MRKRMKARKVSENKYKGIGMVPPGAQNVIKGMPGYASLEGHLSAYQKKILKRTREQAGTKNPE